MPEPDGQKGDNHARLYRQADRRDDLNLSAAWALKAFFDSSRLDDRLYRWCDPLLVLKACGQMPFRELICDLLPSRLGQLIEKRGAFDWTHLLDNCPHLVGREAVQQNERVVVRKDRRQLGGKLDRQTAKEYRLLVVGQIHERVRGERWI